jgi:hypothetical protein
MASKNFVSWDEDDPETKAEFKRLQTEGQIAAAKKASEERKRQINKKLEHEQQIEQLALFNHPGAILAFQQIKEDREKKRKEIEALAQGKKTVILQKEIEQELKREEEAERQREEQDKLTDDLFRSFGGGKSNKNKSKKRQRRSRRSGSSGSRRSRRSGSSGSRRSGSRRSRRSGSGSRRSRRSGKNKKI